MRRDIVDPYRVLFVVGAASGMFGVLLWFFYKYNLIGFYPRQAHGQMMFFSFLWCFVSGFLMTAIPRMTGSSFAKLYEVILVVSLQVFQIIFLMMNLSFYSTVLFLIQNCFLIYFIVSRFLIKKSVPFDGFLFMPMAFLNSFVGLAIYFVQGVGSESTLFLFSGEACILNLIVGLGSRLIPALSRLPNAFIHPGQVTPLRWRKVIFLVFLLNVSYVLQYWQYSNFGIFLRLLVLVFIAWNSFGLMRRSSTFSWVGMGLKVGVLFLILGHGLRFSWFQQGVAGVHLIYIGGFSLITLMVASRVTLAHSQTNLDYELYSRRLGTIVILLISAATLRWYAGVDVVSFSMIGTEMIFIVAILLWLQKHLTLISTKIIKKD